MSEAETAELLTEVRDGVLIVTINRPEALNAMNQAAAQGIAAAMDRLDAEGLAEMEGRSVPTREDKAIWTEALEGWPPESTRVAAVTNWAVTQGPLPDGGGGMAQPVTT